MPRNLVIIISPVIVIIIQPLKKYCWSVSLPEHWFWKYDSILATLTRRIDGVLGFTVYKPFSFCLKKIVICPGLNQ